MVQVPDYDELPLNEALGMRHAWGVFGEGDQLALRALNKKGTTVTLSHGGGGGG